MNDQEARDERMEPCSEECGWCGENLEARDEREALIAEASDLIAYHLREQEFDPRYRSRTPAEQAELIGRLVAALREHPEPEATEARIERVRAEQREVDAQIAESQGTIGRNLEPYWEGRDDASELIAEEIRKSRLTIDEVTAIDRKADR